MSFEKFWFKPAHQPNPENQVEFELKPLDMRLFHNLSRSVAKDGVPAFDVHAEVFVAQVSAWRGLDLECSSKARTELIRGEADYDWLVWIGQVSAELYNRALLGRTEVKGVMTASSPDIF